jgi:hypothetical protein
MRIVKIIIVGFILVAWTAINMTMVVRGGNDIPWLRNLSISRYVFYTMAGVVLVYFLLFSLLFLVSKILKSINDRALTKAKDAANKASEQMWHVKTIHICDSQKSGRFLNGPEWMEYTHGIYARFVGYVVVSFASADSKRERLVLAIPPDHPDVDAAKDLAYLQIVGFDFVAQGLEGMRFDNASSYLRFRV